MRALIKEYKNCRKCGLSKFRRNVVFGRGRFPADIFFVGEAPGKSEDLIGEAFVGPSGRLLDMAIRDAAEMAGTKPPTFYISNVLSCRPTDVKRGPNREPTTEEAWACWSRLEDTYALVEPKVVVFLGKVAERFCKKAWPFGKVFLHPAYIIRKGGTSSTEYRRFCRDLTEVFKEVNCGESK